MRLLIVEDDAALREILAKRLMQEGYAVDESGDGNEGLQYALNTPYDGLILDIMLPGIDGLTLLKHLRARGASCGVLLLTARDAVDDRVRGLDCGADDYLTKPFAYEELSARLRAMLRHHAPSRSPVLRVGGLGDGHDNAHRSPRREAHHLDDEGVCPAGIHDAQRRAGSDAGAAVRPCLGLSGRAGFQPRAGVHRLSARKN